MTKPREKTREELQAEPAPPVAKTLLPGLLRQKKV